MTKWKYFNEAEFIWNGEWSDPELLYKGKNFNAYLIKDAMVESFDEYALEEGIESNEKNFTIYCDNNQDMIRELFEAEDESLGTKETENTTV